MGAANRWRQEPLLPGIYAAAARSPPHDSFPAARWVPRLRRAGQPHCEPPGEPRCHRSPLLGLTADAARQVHWSSREPGGATGGATGFYGACRTTESPGGETGKCASEACPALFQTAQARRHELGQSPVSHTAAADRHWPHDASVQGSSAQGPGQRAAAPLLLQLLIRIINLNQARTND